MSWKNVQYENGKFKTGSGGGGGASALTDLDDVNISSASNGQVLKYNGTSNKWENANESGGSVTDVQVDATSVVNGQGVAVLTTPNVSNLKDTNISNPSSGQTLQFNATSNKWENVTPASGGNVDDVKVNGSSVVDSNKVAQIKSYKELTQAEYNALPASKTSDGILYCIKDAGGADGFPPLIYSLEEREIGVWTDGKPLYQITKIVNAGSTISVSGLSIKHAYAFATTVDGVYRPIPYNDGYYTVWWMQQNTISFASYSGDVSTYTITYQYTKDSDTAGSGTWTTDGTYAHHYSTTEKVIGTWIDGKPLYECCYTFENQNGIGSGDTNLWSIGNDKFIIPGGLVGIMINTNDDTQYTLPWDGNGSRDNALLYQKSTGKIVLRVKNDSWNNNWHYIYILARYTKTTD